MAGHPEFDEDGLSGRSRYFFWSRGESRRSLCASGSGHRRDSGRRLGNPSRPSGLRPRPEIWKKPLPTLLWIRRPTHGKSWRRSSARPRACGLLPSEVASRRNFETLSLKRGGSSWYAPIESYTALLKEKCSSALYSTDAGTFRTLSLDVWSADKNVQASRNQLAC